MSAQPPDGAPSPDSFESVFDVYEVRQQDGQVLYFGDPATDRQRLIEAVWPAFREYGYEVRLARRTGETVLVAEPHDAGDDGVPWTNVALFVATLVSTLWVGATWYYVQDPFSPDILRALPFTLAVMGVIGTHELGHYVMSRYHDVDASLPYFIPFPSLFGTMGAVIRMRGQIPDRDALFDIGVAGPIAGLVAAVVVSVVGLVLPPVTVPPEVINSPSAVEVQFAYPPLLQAIAAVLGEPLSYSDPARSINPVVMGGWIGMFITFLNLIPVGQLDGGHVLRSLVGDQAGRIAPLVPTALFGLGAYQLFVADVGDAAGIWILWGVLTTVVTFAGTVTPVDDSPLDRRRVAVGVLTFVLGALCFMPVPIQVIG
ncbi:site-2 protease family protein [Halobacterium bonnevillei]|uniref:Site-2 protease family protein n=1 Tax=Halobacterium bonnevillei TaxID=2692200 RepID=A0A6B0SPE0_9EURY|nr:site-2 protease family protein [Halobacterium bonnevillei]MXR21501.1 site-2 protease family protein [Halobacterium bonnevillei]